MTFKRKLQVFVSSTYTNLIKERQAAVEAILTAGHIPAGMELFAAGDKSQMEVIKRWIDESDAYLLLLGGRYGSIDPESGKSYTQLEYEYALEQGKAMFALVISDAHLEQKVKIEGTQVLERDHPQELRKFAALVKTKLVKFWDDERDIKLAVLQTLPEFERRPELVGWVPGNAAKTSDILADQIARLAEENVALKAKEPFDVLVGEAIKRLETAKNSSGLTGVPSGFHALDRLTAGWQPAELIIVAARPAMGKTSFAVSAMLNAAVDFGLPVAMFTMALSSHQIVDQLMANYAEIEAHHIKSGNLATHEWQQLHFKIQRLTDAPILLDDTPALSLAELRTKCRRLKAQHDIQLVVIDYLQLMSSPASQTGNRQEELVAITSGLKNLAKELNIPIILLTELGRKVETRGGDKRPQLADLRELGDIDASADVVLLLYRHEYYNITHNDYGIPIPAGQCDLIIAKNKRGPLDTIFLRFMSRYAKFSNINNDFVASDPHNSATSIPPPSSSSPLPRRPDQQTQFGQADSSQETPF